MFMAAQKKLAALGEEPIFAKAARFPNVFFAHTS